MAFYPDVSLVDATVLLVGFRCGSVYETDGSDNLYSINTARNRLSGSIEGLDQRVHFPHRLRPRRQLVPLALHWPRARDGDANRADVWVHPTQVGGRKKQALAGLQDVFGNGRQQMREQSDAEKDGRYTQIAQLKVELDFLQKKSWPYRLKANALERSRHTMADRSAAVRTVELAAFDLLTLAAAGERGELAPAPQARRAVPQVFVFENRKMAAMPKVTAKHATFDAHCGHRGAISETHLEPAGAGN
ncbi:MAG TPA: hypothetical protein VHW24_17990 [Bryobacteraceae bacterium]|nr:hypothetical protein [Bryobacteraceae bacterium]